MTVTSSFTIDTNILIYAIDNTDSTKQSIADAIVQKMISARAILPLQCLNEFYRATTSTKKRLLPPAEAQIVVERALYSLQIVPPIPEDLLAAMKIHQQHSIQFFDALLIATARRAGCRTFFTEDMQAGRAFEDIKLVNPFVLSSEELNNLLS